MVTRPCIERCKIASVVRSAPLEWPYGVRALGILAVTVIATVQTGCAILEQPYLDRCMMVLV